MMIGMSDVLADVAAQVPAVAVGKHDVQQDEVGAAMLEGRGGRRDGLGHLGLEPFPLEVFSEGFGDRRFVFDDENVGLHGPRVARCETCPTATTNLSVLIGVTPLR